MVQATELKRGMVVMVDGAPCRLIEVSQHSPSARGAHLMVKVRFRNLMGGQVLDRTFRGNEQVEEAGFERRKGRFLYARRENGVFMDLETYDQFEMGPELYEAVRGYLLEGAEVLLGIFRERVVSVEPPQVVELTVLETPPVIKGATAQAQLKEAVAETGIRVMVPPYITAGDRIRVDTRDGHFVSRA